MDVHCTHSGQLFTGDAHKAALNLKKHGIRFESACEVFFDPFVKGIDASDGTEVRRAVVGLTEDWTALFVVHLIQEDDVIRIISARQATTPERRDYEDG